MKRFFRETMIFLLVFAMAAALCVLCVAYAVPMYSSNTYASIVNVKFGQLKTTESPRIILLGGSSLAFGLDQYLLSERTGLPVVNTGCSAGLGLPFAAEQAKRHLRRGDIVIAAPEYTISMNDPEPELLILGAIDKEYLSSSMYDDIVRYFPAYVVKKLHRFFRYGILGKRKNGGSGAYQRAAFDDNGQMTFPRPAEESASPEARAKWSKSEVVHSDECAAYLNSFNEYALEKGATLLLSFPPLADTCAPSNPEEIDKAQKQAESAFNFPVISRIRDYLFPPGFMYDTRYHCNSLGEARRTELLADDVNRYLKSNPENL